VLIPYMTIYVVAALCAVIGIGCGIAQNKFPDKRKLLKALQVIAFIGAVVVLGYSFIVGQTVIVFEGKSPTISYSKFILIGEKQLEHTESKQTISNAGGGTWIVNETPGILHVTTAHYGSSSLFGGGDDNSEVLAGTAQHITEGVDNFGPDDPLPQSVSSKSSFESRTQVSW
jgi:hypothetical protein